MHFFATLLILTGVSSSAPLPNDSCVIAGSVVDSQGIGLPGVRVEIASSALISGVRTATTDSVGEYRFARLPGGEYKLTISFAEFRRENIIVLDGHSVKNVLLRTVLNVRSDRRRVRRRSTELEDSVSQRKAETFDGLDIELLRNLPNNRDLWNFVEIAPGYVEASALGAPPDSGNAYLIDGVAVGNPADSTVFGTINYEAVERISINALGSDVRSAMFTGASINVVTRSGRNDFSGEVNYFYKATEWTSDNSAKYESSAIEPENGQRLIDPNVAVGGPIVLKRAWFFASYNYRKAEVERELADNELITVIKDNGPGRASVKITGQWNADHMTSFSYLGGEERLSHRLWMGPWHINRENSLLQEYRDDQVWMLQHTYVLDYDLFFDIRASRFLGSHDILPVQPGETKYDVPLNIFLPDSANTFSNETELERNLVGVEMTYFNDDFSGTHNIIFGIEYERNRAWRSVSEEEYGTYWNGERYRLFDNGSFEAGMIIKRYSGYFQDSWSMTDKLAVTLGARFDNSGYTAEDPDTAPAGSEEILAFTDSGYRLGIAYDLFGTGKTVLRGFAGRYYEGPTVGASEAMAVHFPPERLFYGSVILGPAVGDQWVLWNETQNRNDLAIDEELRNQYTEGFIVAIDHRLDDKTDSSASFVWKKDSDIIGSISSDVLYSVDNISYTGNNGIYRGLYYSNIQRTSPRLLTNPKEGDPGVLGRVYRRYWAFILQLNRRLNNRLSLRATYTFSRNEGTAPNTSADVLQGFVDFSDPNWWVNRDGRLSQDRPHKITATATWLAPLDIFITPLFSFTSGRPYASLATPVDGTVLVDAVDGGKRLDNQWRIDCRIEKIFNIRDSYRIGFIFDVFNLLNNGAITGIVSTDLDSDAYLQPSSIVPPRSWHFGVRLLF